MAYLQFLGAAGTVTGSKHLINTRGDSSGKQGLQVLIDCGLFQGAKEWRVRNWENTPVPAREIDAVTLERKPLAIGHANHRDIESTSKQVRALLVHLSQ